MPDCYRPDCPKDLNTGRKYCSNRCAALDRKRATLERKSRPSIPLSLATQVEKAVGADNASIVLSEVNKYLQDEMISIPVPLTGATYGDLVLSYDGTQDYRPSTQLSFDVIEKMLRSGPVIFAMEMKRAQVYRVFSQGRYKVISPDKELAEVAEAALRLILPKMAQDFTWSAFAYGVSFQEEEWEWKTKYQLGMVDTNTESKSTNTAAVPASSGTTGKGKPFLVPRVPRSVNPQTVDHIRRNPDDESFNGFAQKRKLTGNNIFSSIESIIVEREQALVIPLNERFRNLWGESILKAIYVDWLWYEIIFRTMVRYMERMATPTAIAEAPSRATVTMSGSSTPIKAMDLGLALAGSLAKSNAVAIPSDVDAEGNKLWSIKYLTAEERAQPFLQVLEYLAQAMIRDALSADRSVTQSSGGVGSYNIGEVHAAASAVTSEMILLQFLHYLNMYFMPEFSLYNRGVDGPPIWLRTQAIDTQERDLLMALVAVAGNSPAAMELFYLVDWRTLAETSNIPTLSEEDLAAFKEKLNKESEEKMETQQAIMAKNAAPIPTGGASAFGKGNGKIAPKAPGGASSNGNTRAEDDDSSDNIALENLFEHHIPWMLGEYEAGILYEHGAISEDTIKLFNPFHSKADGRFATGKGGGELGGIAAGRVMSGGPVKTVLSGPKQQIMNVALKQPGFPFATVATALGLAGLGTVAVVALNQKDEEDLVLGNGDSIQDLIDKGVIDPDQIAEHIATDPTVHPHPHSPGQAGEQPPSILLPDNATSFGKFSTDEEAKQHLLENMRAMGIDVDDVAIVDNPALVAILPDNFAAAYNPLYNFIIARPEFMENFRNGDPTSWNVLAHELLHNAQDTGAPLETGFGANPEFIEHIEGQNELMTQVFLSREQGRPFPGYTGYEEQTAAMAGLNQVAAERNNQPAIEYLVNQHSTGMDYSGQFELLRELFPSRVPAPTSQSGYAQIEYPSSSELIQWLREDYNVDSNQALSEMLEQAAR